MSNIFDRLAGASSEDVALPDDANQQSAPAAEGAQQADAVGVTSPEVKAVAQELLKYGYLEESRKPDLFRRAVTRASAIATILEPLDLRLEIDTHRGVAFLVVEQGDAPGNEQSDDVEAAWTHPLVRRQRLTLEQSLLVALLRQVQLMHEQEAGVGESPAKIAVDDLMPQFLTYMEDSGSDAKNESRLLNLLDQLKVYGIVSEVDKSQEVTVRPLIVHLANPDSLAALLRVLRERAQEQDAMEKQDA